ncbi:MAG: ABC transporter permease, partial [Desulfobacterales bacterium]|nr:ABC transporter permease [Desulfobacterales bacterium]
MLMIRKLGAATLRNLRIMGVMGLFLFKGFFYSVVPPVKITRVLKQVYFIGFQSTVVIMLTGCFAGMVLGFQGYNSLRQFGSDAFLG